VTKNELVKGLRAYVKELAADDTMLFGDIDCIARQLADMRLRLDIARKRPPPPMRPVGGKARELKRGEIGRNLSTPEGREFWDGDTCEVDTWPDWKRAGINVTETRATPRRIKPG
jgi:hypothetical protein